MKILLLAVCCGIMLFMIIYLIIAVKTRDKLKLRQRMQLIDTQQDSKYWLPREDNAETDNNRTIAPLMDRVIKPFYKKIEYKLLQLTPQAIKDTLAQRIIYAGKQYTWNVNALIVFWSFSMAAGFLLAFIFVSKHSDFIFIQRTAFLLAGLLIGGYLPFMFLNILIQKRQQNLLRQLPEVLDLLCVSVQAGLSFDASAAKITKQMKGAFVEECDRMLRDVRMGMTRKAALQNMAKRCNLQEIQLFTTAIIQSERLGTSMGKTLTVQADNMRERRMQRAKAAALKAPIKIIFPLVLFIFPALFVITLLPAILSFAKSIHP